MSILTLLPAYGRDYKSKAEAIVDFIAGKDFIVSGEDRYTNIMDLEKLGHTSVIFRYNSQRVVTSIKKTRNGWA